MWNPVHGSLDWAARALASLGIIDAERGERTAALAWPRMITGLARSSQRVVDFAMLGTVLGPAALAGVGFAFAFWRVGSTLGLGLAGATIGFVSQSYGADDPDGVDRAIKSSVWVSLAVALPLTVVFAAYPRALIGPLARDATTTAFGATYLQIVALGIVFEFCNKVASRVLVGAEDARTPMVVRGGGAVLNIVLNAVFIFGLGLGVAGAALGTLVATLVVTLSFALGLLTGRLPFVGAFPVRIRRRGPLVDWSLTRELVVRAAPLMVRRVAQTAGRFPMLAIAATFGPVFVAAYEVSRRIMTLLRTPNWGFSLAASSLVGQHVGRGDDETAVTYGRDILRFSVAVHAVSAVVVFVLARPIAGVFVDDPAALAATVPFVRVGAVSALGLAVEGVANGVLKGSGDTRWPMYGMVLGLYVVGIPVAYAGSVTALGVVGLYVALLAQTFVPAAVSSYRFRSGAWLRVAGAAPSPGD